MDPLTAVLLSGIVAGAVKKANDSARDVAADWRALKNGAELPSHKYREALLEAQREAIKKGVADPTRMTATEYSRFLNNLGRQPGVLMLARNQYRNMVSAADRRLSSYWDEMERRANDEDYRKKQERKREQARQEAQARREERKRRIREGYAWVKDGAANRTKTGREKLRDWLGDHAPGEKKDPPKDPPQPPPGDSDGNDGNGRGWWEPGGRSTTGAGDADPGGTQGTGPHDPSAEERNRRLNEWIDWVSQNQRYGQTTVTEKPTAPGREPAPQPGLTRGPGALGPAPDTSTAPTAGGNPMADQNNTPTPQGQSGGGSTPQATGDRIAQSSIDEFNRKADAQITKPLGNPPGGRKPAAGAGPSSAPARYRKGTAQRTARTRGRGAALSELVGRLDHLIHVFDAGAAEIRDIVEDLAAIRGGHGLQEALVQWSANLTRDTAHGLQVAQYLAMADQQIGAVASQFQEAPKDLDAYSGVNG